MNIFIISSWYPNKKNNLSGCFIKEQVQALGENFQGDNFIVSTWGYDSADIPTRRPWEIFSVLLWRVKQSPYYIHHRNEFHHEFFSPAISWSARLPFSGAERPLDSHRKNLLAAISKFGNIDIIHCHVSYPAGHIGHTLSKEFNIPYVITEHMGPFPFKHLIKNKAPIKKIFTAFKNASGVIAVSNYLADEIKKMGCGKSTVIPNMVNDEKFSISPPKSNSQSFIFFSLSNISYEKGIDTLIYAIKAWENKPNEVVFYIGGTGPRMKQYMNLAKTLNVSNSIKWLGKINREEVAAAFNQCNVFVLPSRLETFGVVYAEALACGKPIISTRCGGPESIVTPRNGLLVSVDDPLQLAQAMQKLYKNWHQYNPINIRKDFLNKFSRQIVATQIHEVYESILKSRNASFIRNT